jgi:hypothetical protein
LRILVDVRYAGRVVGLDQADVAPMPALPITTETKPLPPDLRPALQLLACLQREGRLVDFVQQDILTSSDVDVAAAARVVHDGCKRVLKQVVQFAPVLNDDEGSAVAVPLGYDAAAIQLTGNVSGAPPFRGVLRHRGWRANGLTLPDIIGDADCTVVAQAEVEL